MKWVSERRFLYFIDEIKKLFARKTDVTEAVDKLREEIPTGGGAIVVKITGNDTDGYTADKTYEEIVAAYKAGATITANWAGYILQLTDVYESEYNPMVTFGITDSDTTVDVGISPKYGVLAQTSNLSESYQLKTSYQLTTNDKNIVGAINEVNEKIPYYKRELVLELTQDDFTVITDDEGYSYLQYTTDKLNWITSVNDVGYEVNLITHNGLVNERDLPFDSSDINENGIVMVNNSFSIDNGYSAMDKTQLIMTNVDDIGEFVFKLYKIGVKRLPIECQSQIILTNDPDTFATRIPSQIYIESVFTNNIIGLDSGNNLCLHPDFCTQVRTSVQPVRVTSNSHTIDSVTSVGGYTEHLNCTLYNYNGIDAAYSKCALYWIWVIKDGVDYFVRLSLVDTTEKKKAEWTGNFFTKNGEFFWVKITRKSTENKVDLLFKRML